MHKKISNEYCNGAKNTDKTWHTEKNVDYAHSKNISDSIINNATDHLM